MAMIQTEKGPLPKDAVPLTKMEAYDYQMKLLLKEWEPKSEVWAFRYGRTVLSVASMVSSIVIHRHYRRKLKLRNHGLLSTYLPTVAIPTMSSALAHLQMVTKDIVLSNSNCPVCLGTKATLVQNSFGLIYPLVLSPLCSFTFAVRKLTYRMPYYKDVRGHYDLWWKLTKPLTGKIAVIFCLQTILASFITYAEEDQLFRARQKLMKFAEKIQ